MIALYVYVSVTILTLAFLFCWSYYEVKKWNKIIKDHK